MIIETGYFGKLLCRLNSIVFILLKVNLYSAVAERVKSNTGKWITFLCTCFVFYLSTADRAYYIYVSVIWSSLWLRNSHNFRIRLCENASVVDIVWRLSKSLNYYLFLRTTI